MRSDYCFHLEKRTSLSRLGKEKIAKQERPRLLYHMLEKFM